MHPGLYLHRRSWLFLPLRRGLGEGDRERGYARLVENGYSGTAVGNVDEKDFRHMEYLRDLVSTADRATNKASRDA